MVSVATFFARGVVGRVTVARCRTRLSLESMRAVPVFFGVARLTRECVEEIRKHLPDEGMNVSSIRIE